jgi:hypothetical protein
MNIVWTVEQTGLLAQAWRAGQASREIGTMVGMSASAVRCKRRRLGLPARSDVSQEATERQRGAALVGSKVGPNPNRSEAAPPLNGSMPRPWTQREARECAWPVLGFGDETLSCCLPVELHKPYCAGHMALLRREPWPPVDPGNVVLFRRRA